MVKRENLLIVSLVVLLMIFLLRIQVWADTDDGIEPLELEIESQKNKKNETFNRKKLKMDLKEAIFQNPGSKSFDVVQYGLSKQEWEMMINDILQESHAEMFVAVSYQGKGSDTVTALDIAMDDDYVLAVEKLDEINENQDEPLETDELLEVKAHYAELQAYYESNPDYFGIPAPYFTDKGTESSPMGAIIDMAGLDADNLDIVTLDKTIVGMYQGLQSYVQYYGEALLKVKEEAMSCLDENMSDVEKCLVLHDYIANHAIFNIVYSNDFIESTSFGALLTDKCVCLGYASAYTYLVQSAFPEIYKNADGSWKTKDDVKETYIIDYAKCKDIYNVHYFNVIKIDGQWYYSDVCMDDLIVEERQWVRMETDGNCHHSFFLTSYQNFLNWYANRGTVVDSPYKCMADETKYESAWFSNVNSPICYNDDYWFYVEGQIDWENHKNIEDYVDKGDQIKARNRKNGKVTVLVDFRSGNIQSLTEGDQGINKKLAAEYEQDIFYSTIYPGMQHSVGLYKNKLYFNISNKIYQYDLDTSKVEILKEYNTVNVAKDSSASFEGASFYTVSQNSGETDFTVSNHPVASMCIKEDGKMYVSIATNFSNSTNPVYSVEAVNYFPVYSIYGETRSKNDKFYWCANIKETLDMKHITGANHSYQNMTIAPSCEQQGFDEIRCTECGISSAENRKNYTEAISHHYVYNSEEKIYVCSGCKHVSANVKEHNYGKPEFRWEMNGKEYSCQAVFTCSVCKEKMILAASVSSTVSKEASCTEAGEIIYTASVSFQEEEYKDIKRDTLEAKGHIYGKLEFSWAEDYSMCNAHFSCTKDEAVKIIACQVTTAISNADYNQEGKAVYTATCTLNEIEYKDIKTVAIPALVVQTAFEKSSYSIYATQSQRLSITSNYPEEAIIFMQSSNPKLLKVSNDGTVEGIAAGRVRVTAQTKSGQKIQTLINIKIPRVVLTASEAPLQVKKTTMELKVKSKIATDSVKRWSSSNKKVAVVSQKGKITARKIGKTIITVLMKSGAKASCEIKVQKAPVQIKKLSINKSSITLNLKGSPRVFQIITAKTPVTVTNKVTYQSSNKKIVSVSRTGKLTARKSGTTTVTVKCGKKTRKIKVKVRRK